MTALWHPFADMADVQAGGELVLASGDGQFVVDEQGRRYLDATAGLWFANVGHGRREIADAVGRQAATLAAHSVFGDLANRPALEVAERVSALAPVADSKVFFTSGGSDSVDTAAKLVRRFWQVTGHAERTTLVTRDRAYHGMHWGGTALSGIDANKQGYGQVTDDVVQVPWDDATALADTVDALGADRVAAFFCEPVIGAGGVYAAGEEYLRAAREVCRERGVLWVSDEVITGFGRLGDWFASGRYDLQPDVLLTAKGLTSGYVPMGAVVVSPAVADPFWSQSGNVWRHGYTYSGHAVAAAAASANLDILEREGLVGRVRQLEPVLATALARLADLPAVTEVRAGAGLLAAVQVDPDRLVEDPGFGRRVVAGMRSRGVLTRTLVDGSLQVSPPFVVEEGDLKTFVVAAEEAFAEADTA
jgi:adenosylmethionine-8-amino-7-oxononanoate aminotransferase